MEPKKQRSLQWMRSALRLPRRVCSDRCPSGAGKTTVLNILGGMDQATSGEVLVDGRNIARYNSRQLTGYRRNDIGFVFQFYNLVPNLTALENVELALQICKNPLDAREVLEEVGLKRQTDQFPGTAFRW